MQTTRSRFFLLFLSVICAIIFGIVGCRKSGLSGTVEVTGIVVYKGDAVEGASVSFSPTGEGRSAVCTTDSQGKFEMWTLEPGDGVFPGNYIVTIAKYEDENKLSEEEAKKYFASYGTFPKAKYKHYLPEKYFKTTTSGLNVTVQNNDIHGLTFELSD